MKGAIAKAEEIVAATPNAWMPQQFENPANLEIHRRTTAQEILRDFPEGIDFLITGVGTGGHITGVSEMLKKTWKKLKTFAVEPAKSPVLSGGTHTPHKLQGIGAGFVPANFHRDVVDGFIQVTEEDAFSFARRAAREEGIFVGPSPARRSPPWRRSSPSCRRRAACSRSATTRASGICRWKDCLTFDQTVRREA